jgi:hypothetical protein
MKPALRVYTMGVGFFFENKENLNMKLPGYIFIAYDMPRYKIDATSVTPCTMYAFMSQEQL